MENSIEFDIGEQNTNFMKIFSKIMFSYGQIMNYIKCCINGFNKISKDLLAENYDSTFPEISKMIPNLDGIKKTYGSIENFCAEFSANMTEDIINQSTIVMESSSIVLMHSILDISLYELILITTKLNKPFWDDKIDMSDIKFKEFMKKNKTDIINQRFNNRISKLERESVLFKCNYLLKICKPFDKECFVSDFEWNYSILEKYDKKRHELIHNNFKKMEINEAFYIIEYFKNTALHFCFMIQKKFGLKFDFNELTTIIHETTKQPYSKKLIDPRPMAGWS